MPVELTSTQILDLWRGALVESLRRDATDRLGANDLLRRKTDEDARRSILVQRTVKGSVYLSEFGNLIQSSLSEAQVAAKSAPDLKIGTGVRLRNFRINTRQGPAFAFLAKRGPDRQT